MSDIEIFTWQTILIIALLILMPPVGLAYLIYLLRKKKKELVENGKGGY